MGGAQVSGEASRDQPGRRNWRQQHGQALEPHRGGVKLNVGQGSWGPYSQEEIQDP